MRWRFNAAFDYAHFISLKKDAINFLITADGYRILKVWSQIRCYPLQMADAKGPTKDWWDNSTARLSGKPLGSYLMYGWWTQKPRAGFTYWSLIQSSKWLMGVLFRKLPIDFCQINFQLGYLPKSLFSASRIFCRKVTSTACFSFCIGFCALALALPTTNLFSFFVFGKRWMTSTSTESANYGVHGLYPIR